MAKNSTSKHFALTTLLMLLLSACGGSSGIDTTPPNDGNVSAGDTQQTANEIDPEYITPATFAQCSNEDIKARVAHDMNDYYIYYDQVPTLTASEYDAGEDYIRALRVEPDIYSFVTDEATQGALTEEGMTTGLGIRLSFSNDNSLRFREVLIGSPAWNGKILRGDELVSLNGRLISDYTEEQANDILRDDSASVTLGVRTGIEATRNVVLQRGTFRWYTVSWTHFETEGFSTVGYINVRSFLATTEGEINQAINYLINANIDELIVDLRYNPGGRTRVAEHLAAKIVGPSIDGKPFLLRTWNNKYAQLNNTSSLEAVSPSLALPRIVVLQTERSASASEAFVNGLEPYIDVTVIGGTTEGKIYTSSERTYCGKSIFAMRSTRTNSLGVSVQGGIVPDCTVSDDWFHQATSLDDALMSAGLDFIDFGTCSGSLIAANRASTKEGAKTTFFDGTEAVDKLPGDIVD